jgi:hypothetical protein
LSAIAIIGHTTSSRRWEGELLERLKALGHVVSVRHAAVPAFAANGLDRVLSIESRRFGTSLASRTPPLAAVDAGPAELVIDLTGAADIRGVPVLSLEFCGQKNFPAGLVEMLASGELPELVARLDGVAVGRAHPMLGDRLWLSRLGNDLLAGAISLVVQSVTRFFAGKLTPVADATEPAPTHAGFLRHYLPFVARGFTGRVMQKLRLGRRPFYWQVAYRLLDGPGIAETGRLDGAPFTVLADDGARFYADPFVIERDGRHYLFVEEFPYRRGRGVISVAELGEDGRFGVPKVVLEEPHHLSYPQVFAEGGEIFMIPESSAARELVLYRAASFPDRWVRDTVLLAGKDFNDATLIQSGGRYWLFGTERYGQGSASDTMAVYSAASLRGPWEPHALNPIVIDRAGARPGGAFIRRGQTLVLPVQDGSRAYGGGLGLMDLVRLDAGDIVFAPPRPIGTGSAWMRTGIHTLNRVGRLEVVDSAD